MNNKKMKVGSVSSTFKLQKKEKNVEGDMWLIIIKTCLMTQIAGQILRYCNTLFRIFKREGVKIAPIQPLLSLVDQGLLNCSF